MYDLIESSEQNCIICPCSFCQQDIFFDKGYMVLYSDTWSTRKYMHVLCFIQYQDIQKDYIFEQKENISDVICSY